MIYLYAKQHSVTGLRYFGKTKRDPYKYNGSGKYWKDHIKKHGVEFVITTWVHAYTDPKIAEYEALFFSKVYNIVESDEWANLIPEDSKGGGSNKGRKVPWLEGKSRPEHSEKMKGKMAGENNPMFDKEPWNKNKKGLWKPTLEQRTHLSDILKGNDYGKGNKGKIQSTEWKEARLSKIRGKTYTMTCPHCNKTGGRMMLRWHFDNCREINKE